MCLTTIIDIIDLRKSIISMLLLKSHRIYTFTSTFTGDDSSWDVLVQRSLGASITNNYLYAG